jgi:ABC-type multidrug transport system ATPase subunit
MEGQKSYVNSSKSSVSYSYSYIGSFQSPASNKEYPFNNFPNYPSSINVPKPIDVKSRPEVLLTWESLNYTVIQRTRDLQALNNVSGFANPRELLVIMGASGSGKSTLLKVLAKRAGGKKSNIKISGSIKANGSDVKNIKYRKLVGYVTQEDILMETLTPRETLEFSAALRLSENQEYNNARIERLIEEMKIEGIQNSLLGNYLSKSISGGERKRVAIACELIADPPLLFLDEPTSGLDSCTAELIVQILINQSRKGHTIICTLHQPSYKMFNNFDRLILMTSGSIIYQAPPKYADKYFKKIGFRAPKLINPADYFLEILHIKNRFSLSTDEKSILNIIKDAYISNQDLVFRYKSII